jgi:hypothetical protein
MVERKRKKSFPTHFGNAKALINKPGWMPIGNLKYWLMEKSTTGRISDKMFAKVVKAILDEKEVGSTTKNKYVKMGNAIYRVGSDAHKRRIKLDKQNEEILARGGIIFAR